MEIATLAEEIARNVARGPPFDEPLATVVIGGIMSATLLSLLVLPALYAWAYERVHRGAIKPE